MAKWEVCGEGRDAYVPCSLAMDGILIADFGINCESTAKEIARKLNAFDEMLEALNAVRGMMIPGMDWTDEIGIKLKNMADSVIAKAEGK